jgi:hypothetical protein
VYVFPGDVYQSLSSLLAQLVDGLCQDRDGSILLEYARCPPSLFEELDAEEQGSSEDEDMDVEPGKSTRISEMDDMDVDSHLLTG